MAAKRRRNQEQEAASAAMMQQEAASPQTQDGLSMSELFASVSAFRKNQAEMRAMLEMVTNSIDNNDKAMQDVLARLKTVEETVLAHTRNMSTMQRKIQNDLQEQENALQDVQNSINKFVLNADHSMERQQSDLSVFMQEVSSRLDADETIMKDVMDNQQAFDAAINKGMDANEILTSTLDTVRQEMATERQSMLTSFIEDMNAASAKMQEEMQQKLEATKAAASKEMLEAMTQLCGNIREDLTQSQSRLAALMTEAQKFQAFRRVAFGHSTRPLAPQ